MENTRKRNEVLSLSLCDLLRKRHKVSEVKRDWTDLHLDLLTLVLKKIESFQDYFAFRGVCTTWRHVAATNKEFNRIFRLPFLVQVKDERVVFSNPMAAQHELSLPAICNTIANMNDVQTCVGCKGWILVVQKNGNMNLVHIVSGTHIKLPCHEKSHSQSRRGIYKMVLSSSPLTSPFKYTLMIVYSHGKLAYWMPGDEIFTEVESIISVQDVIYSSETGYFYGLSLFGEILLIMGTQRYPTRLAESGRIFVAPFYVPFQDISTFMVESNGYLLLVVRRGVTRFAVFKYTEYGMIEIKKLGNRAIYVGGISACISVNAGEIPGCKPNRIYFTGHGQMYSRSKRMHQEKCHMGVYNLEDGIVEHFDCSGKILCNELLCTCSCWPFWATPTFV